MSANAAEKVLATTDATVNAMLVKRTKARRSHVRRALLRGGAASPVESIAEVAVISLSMPERLELARVLLTTVADETTVTDPVRLDTQVRPRPQTDPEEAATSSDGRTSVLTALATLGSTEVAEILAPTGEPIRSVAQKRRKNGELIGLPVGKRPNYHYPAFQFDRERHKIHDVVIHTNRRLAVDRDPYGAASWWMTPTDLLDGKTPLEDLEAGDFTEVAADNIIDMARRGM